MTKKGYLTVSKQKLEKQNGKDQVDFMEFVV